MPVEILIVDDHPVVSHGLNHILSKENGFRVAGIAQTAAEAMDLAKTVRPHVIILDISLNGTNSINLIGQLLDASKGAGIIMYTMHDSKSYISRSLRAGALGYVLKGDRPEELIAAVHEVVRGKMYLSSTLEPSLLAELIAGRTAEADRSESLTSREYEIASLIAQGLHIDEIGKKLFISPRTVRVHRTNIMHKLACANVHELLLKLPGYFP